MTIEQIDNLIQGQKYVFVALQFDQRMKSIKKTYVGEYRGWNTSPDWEEFVLFWIDGEGAAQPFHYQDIKAIKKAELLLEYTWFSSDSTAYINARKSEK